MDDAQNTTQTAAPAPQDARPARGGRGRRPERGGKPGARGGRPGGKRDMPRSEFDQKTILLRRVARVIAGGRRFSFSAAIVIGDHKGRVGVGIGKGGDTALAMEKAMRDAKKNMVRVKTTDSMSIPHDVMAKESSGIVSIRPAPERGIVAGSSVKLVLELAGVKDVTAKILSPSKNKLNIARATVKALASIK
jgi:small subunit ribosomal protein S5